MRTSNFTSLVTQNYTTRKGRPNLTTTLVVSLEAFSSASLKSDGDIYCLDLQVYIVFFSFPLHFLSNILNSSSLFYILLILHGPSTVPHFTLLTFCQKKITHENWISTSQKTQSLFIIKT